MAKMQNPPQNLKYNASFKSNGVYIITLTWQILGDTPDKIFISSPNGDLPIREIVSPSEIYIFDIKPSINPLAFQVEFGWHAGFSQSALVTVNFPGMPRTNTDNSGTNNTKGPSVQARQPSFIIPFSSHFHAKTTGFASIVAAIGFTACICVGNMSPCSHFQKYFHHNLNFLTSCLTSCPHS
jgi:hypothetical protein